MDPIAASPELERLNPFVGVWDTDGEVRATASKRPRKFRASDTYEWLAGGHFLLHRFEADMPDGEVQGIEIIGYSRENRSYPMHSYDSSGNATVMHATVENGSWTFMGQSIRFTGGFREGGKVFAGVWESRGADGAAWQPWMNVRLRKVG